MRPCFSLYLALVRLCPRSSSVRPSALGSIGNSSTAAVMILDVLPLNARRVCRPRGGNCIFIAIILLLLTHLVPSCPSTSLSPGDRVFLRCFDRSRRRAILAVVTRPLTYRRLPHLVWTWLPCRRQRRLLMDAPSSSSSQDPRTPAGGRGGSTLLKLEHALDLAASAPDTTSCTCPQVLPHPVVLWSSALSVRPCCRRPLPVGR